MSKAIQVIGTQRSGSNLLRLILNQFEEISAPHPPHILKTFIPLIDYYGNLSSDINFLQLIKDVCEFIDNNPVSWINVNLQPDEIKRRCKERNLFEIFRVVYEMKAESDGAEIWCCKSTFNAYYIDDLEKHNLKLRYIYLYRDGRDVAASFRKTIVGPKHIYHLANTWRKDQKAAQNVLKVVGPERFFPLKYEDLITDPETVLEQLSSDLGLEYNQNIMSFYNSQESINTAIAGQMWENLSKPIIRDHFGLYKQELSETDIRLFDKIAGEELIHLGYNNVAAPGGDLDFSRDQIIEFNRLNEEMKMQVISKASPEELNRRSKQESVLEKINQRFIKTV